MASPPLLITPLSQVDIDRGDGAIVQDFIEGYCRVTKESVGGRAGDLLRLRQWQINVTNGVFARRVDGRLKHRETVIGLPRKNGKSGLGSAYGLYALVMGAPGSEIYSAAADKDQARIVFNVAKRMVQLDPELSDMLHVWRDTIENLANGSIYKVLSSESFTKEGLNPSVILYDELHAAPNDELYDVLAMAQGARIDPQLIVISTAGVKTDQTGQDSIMYRRYQYGQKVASGEIVDDSFFMAWWGAPEGSDYLDPEIHKAANPGYDDLIDPEDFKSSLGKVHANTFMTKRLNMWVSSKVAWLPDGAWKKCLSDSGFNPGERGVVLGFDGSRSGDSTVLVAVTVEAEPQIKVIGHWAKPRDDNDWTVPRAEVKDTIRKACRDYDVREIAADDYIWQDALEQLLDEGLPVVAFPQNQSRMGPATQRFYEMVINQKIWHDGDKALARHLDNAKLKTSSAGAKLEKDMRNSPRKIDLAVASVIAVDRAAFWLTEPLPGTFKGVAVSDIKFVW